MPENQPEQAFNANAENQNLQEKYLRSLEFDKVLELVAQCGNTPAGKTKCLELRPFTNKNTIQKELDFVFRICRARGVVWEEA